MAWCVGPAGVGEQGKGTRGSPGTWEFLLSPRLIAGGAPAYQLQARAGALDSDGNKTRVLPWYRQAKATKCGGMGSRTSEHLVVPLKQGNRSHRDPGEGAQRS
jgi:hypothetical protein